MTAGRPDDTAEAAGGEGWAKTVVDGIAEGEPEPADGTSVDGVAVDGDVVDGDVVDDGVVDDDVIEAELVDELDGTDGDADDDADDVGPPVTGEAGPGGAGDGTISVEDLVADLERVSAERDQYLDASRRLQAEFENYKKQVIKRETEARERANDSLIGELLPVLDAFDGALANGAEDVAPMRATFLDALGKQGLERIDPADDPFDPNLHEAVLHEDGDGGDGDGPVVAEVMRAGYVWKGRVLRPAMVKTRG